MDVIECPECRGRGETAVALAFGVYLANEGELEIRPCRLCKGAKETAVVDTKCAICDVDIQVHIPPTEVLGERYCPDCAGQ